MIIEIDLVKLTRWELNINEYLTLLKIEEKDNFDIPFNSSREIINELVRKNLIQFNDDNSVVYLTNKALKIVGKEEVNFDELFDLYPYKTPTGRILRTKNKEQLGKLTRDYKLLSEKYLRKIKNVELHNTIIRATELMLKDYKRRGSLEYLKKLETYINQNGWEPYVDQIVDNVSFSSEGGNVEKL